MKKLDSGSKDARRRARTRRPPGRRASRAAVAPTPDMSTALSRTVGDVQDIGRDLGSAGWSLARGTLRLAVDVGALVGLAGKNVIGGTATLAAIFVHSAETLVGSAGTVTRKPPTVAGPRRAATARAVAPRASSTG